MLDKCEERIDSYRSISEWLDSAGYKCKSPSPIPMNQLLPDKSVVNVTNMTFENKSIVINFSLRIPTSNDEDFEDNVDE